ncbi:MAG: HD domain-containing protein [Lachnospiraceae bacterium]|nr:HD domain-containing protein [Lachnospiraceae bacterium]
METIFYGSIFVISILLTLFYFVIWHKHFDINITLVFTVVPIACLGYLMGGEALNLREAVIALKIQFLGGCFLQSFVLFSILNLCHVLDKKLIKSILFGVSVFMFMIILTIGHSDAFYTKLSFRMMGGVPVLSREYGPLHTVFYVYVILFFLIGLAAIVYSLLKKSQIPRTVIYLLAIPDFFCMLSYLVIKRLYSRLDFVPLVYVIAQVIFLVIIFRMSLYNVSATVIDSMVRKNALGYASFDFQYRYLGSNESAKVLIPELADLGVDDVIGYRPAERKMRHFLDSFKRNPGDAHFYFHVDSEDGDEEKNRIYSVEIANLYDGRRKRGYFLSFTDDTERQRYIELLDNYNDKLEGEVAEKTRHIVEMHDNLIMSLAMMVESRDNSTGGHIKRTSDGVRILVEEIRKEGKLDLTPEFRRNVVKAAPMHDLGKIAVDDAVLRKNGRFTDEEYAIMKKHAAEGARVIHEVLLHTQDEDFKLIAENVAHYHHERWDGSGYPEGLKGEEIPIEARIMAIADVYDALVSKRVYKEAFSFEKADGIIMEGMGTQFDPGLKTVYENARPLLEEYYKNQP